MGNIKYLTPKIKQTLELYAEVSKESKFFIQDTETTGLDQDSEIYEFAGVLYDGTKTGSARFKKVHYYLRPSKTTLNELRARGALSKKNPWEHVISDEELQDLIDNPGKQHAATGGVYINNADFAKQLRKLDGIPQIAYNAVFDVNKELNYLPSNYKLKSDVYDAATMVIDLFPSIINDDRFEGQYNLEKIYNILCKDYKKIINAPGKTFPASYGGKPLSKQKHTAISDVVDMLIPVLGAIADYIRMHPGWDIKNYKGKQYYYVHKKNESGAKKSEGDYLTEVAETEKLLKRANLKGIIIPYAAIKEGYKSGSIAAKKNPGLKNAVSAQRLINLLPANIKSGEIHARRFNSLSSDRADTMKSLTKDIYGSGKRSSTTLIKELDQVLRGRGITPQYQYNQGTGSVTVYLIPQNEGVLANILAQQKAIPTFRFFLARSDGSINLYTRAGTAYKGVNGIFSDYIGGKGVVYTAEQLQLMELIKAAGSVSGNDPERAAKSLNFAVRNSSQTLEALQDFVTGDTAKELSNEKSGTGSKIQMKARLGFMRNERFVVHLVEENRDRLLDLFWSNDPRAFHRNKKEDCLTDIYADINDIINQLGTFGSKMGNHVIKKEERYAYLRKDGDLWNKIKRVINSSIGRLQFEPGSAGENSVGHMSVSLTSPASLNLFGLSPMDRRHSLQSAHYFGASSKAEARKLRESRKSLVTEALVEAGITASSLESAYAKLQFATTADYTRAYKEIKKKKMKSGMSEAEFIREYGTAQHGLHSGGSVYAKGSQFEKQYLDASKEGTKVVDTTAVYEWLFQHRRSYFELDKDRKHWYVDSNGMIVTNHKLGPATIEKYWREAVIAVGRLPLDASIKSHEVIDDGSKWRIYFKTDKPMEGAGKVLVGGFDERTVAVGIHPDIYKQILIDKGLSMDTEFLMNPDEGKFGSKHLSGLVGSYLNAIVAHSGALSSAKKKGGDRAREVLATIDQYSPLQGILKYDKTSQYLVIKDHGLEKAIRQHGIDDVIRSLNKLGEKVFGGPGFIESVLNKNDEKTHGWKVTNNWRGYTAINQADLYEYGAPGGRVVSFDYRAQQAVSRMTSIAGLKGSVLEKTILSGMTALPQQLNEFKKVRASVDRAIAESQATARADFDINKLADCVCIGWGSNVPAGGIDLSDPNFSTAVRNAEGKFDPELYAKSVYGAIDRARQAKAKQLGKKPDDILVYVDLQGTFSESTMYSSSDRQFGQAVRYLFLPNFSKLGADRGSKEYGDMPSFEREFNSLLYNIQRYNEHKKNGDSIEKIEKYRQNIGTKAFAFQHAYHNDVYNKEGATYRRINSTRATHSASFTATAGNYTMINDREFSAVERKLASTSGLLSYEDMFKLINSDEVREAKTDLQKVNAKKGHLAVLQETLRSLWAGQETEVPQLLKDFMKKYVAEDCVKIELMSERFKRQEEELRDRLTQQGKTLPQIQKEMNLFAKKCASEKQNLIETISTKVEEHLQDIFNKTPEQLLTADPIEKLISAIIPGASTDTRAYNILNEVLSAFIVESVTLGSNIFNKRNAVNQMNGMSGIFMRYPLSNGLDVQFTDFYVDKAGVVKGTIVLGQGTGHETNLDFDGDHPPIWMPFLDYRQLGKDPEKIRENMQIVQEQFKQLKTVNQRMRSGLAFIDSVLLNTDQDELNFIASKEAEEFSEESFMGQIAAILAGRKYKGNVGRLSNTYQAVTNAMFQHRLDETGIRSNSRASKVRAVRSIALRAFYETLTQDAISSKKVYKRLKGASNVESVLYDLETLLEKIHDGWVYQDNTSLSELFKLLDKMNLGDMATRIIYNIVAAAQAIDPSGEVLKIVLGSNVDARDFMVGYDENNQAISFGGLTKNSEPKKIKERIDKMESLFNDQFMKKIIKSSEATIEKATRTTRNQYGVSLDRIMNMRRYRVGMSQANAYSLSIGQSKDGKVIRIHGITKEELDSLSDEARKQLEDQLLAMRIEAKDRGAQIEVVSEKYGKYIATSLDDILNDTTTSYKMYSVYTGLDKSHGQHRSYVDDRRYNARQMSSLQNLSVYSVTQIASVLYTGQSSNNPFPAEYGTFFHAIIEAIANGEIPMDENYQVDPQALKNWIEQVWRGKNPNYDKTDVIVAIQSNEMDPDTWCVSQDMLNTVIEKTNILIQNLRVEYPEAFASVNDVRAKLQVMSETTHGVVVRLGNRNVVISGTIDQIWLNYKELDDEVSGMSISDIKTSQYAYLEYVVQLSLYGAILRAWEQERNSGVAVSNQAKLTINPRGGHTHGVVNVNMLSDDELLKFVEEAVYILELQDPEARRVEVMKMVRKWNPVLVSRLELDAGMQTIDSLGTQKFVVGGAELSTILNAHSREVPLTALEERLYGDYLFYKNGGDPSTRQGFEAFVAEQRKKGKITEAEYQEHIQFRAARGQYVADYLSRITDPEQQKRAFEEVLRRRENKAENDISYDFAFRMGFLKKHGAAIRKADISKFYTAEITASTYNTHQNIEEDDDMARTDELIDALMNTLVQFKNGNGAHGHAPASGSGDSPQIKFDKMAEDNNKNMSLVEQVEKYYQLEKDEKNLKLDLLTMDPTDLNYTRKEGLLQQVQANMAEFNKVRESTGEAWDNNLSKLREGDLKDQEKILDKQNKLLEKQGDLLNEIAKKEAEITVAKQNNQKAQAQQLEKEKEILKAKVLSEDALRSVGVNPADIVRDPNSGKMILARAEDKQNADALKEAAKERTEALRRYKSLMTQRSRDDATSFDLSLTYRTTYDKIYKQSILEQMENLSAQNSLTEEEIRTIVEKFQNDPAFAAEREKIDKVIQAQDAVRRGRVAVKHKGQDTLWGQLGSQMTNIITRFTQMGAAYKIIGKVREGFNQVIQSAKELDKAMTDLRIVTGQSGEEASNTMQNFAKLARQLGMTTTEVASAGTAWLRQGYTLSETTDLITSSLYLSRLGMISVDEATKDLTSSLKGFKLEAKDAMDVVDKLTALDVKAATTAGEIATGLAQFANLARMNGINIDQASAMVATIADVSQVSGAQAGNSLKMMLSRYGTVKSGKFDSMSEGEENTSLNDVEKVLNRIGVSIRDSNLQFREFDAVLDDIAEKWDTLDNISQNAIATAMAGTRQREAFLVLMSNMDKYRSLTEESENSKGTAEAKYQSYSEQLEASQKRLKAAWEELAQSASVNKFLTSINNVATFMVEKLPIILKYVARLIAMTQGYKLPKIMSNLGLLDPIAEGAAGIKAGAQQFAQNVKNNGLLRGISKTAKKGITASRDSYNKKIDSYYDKQQGGILTKVIEPVNNLINALNANTKALGGNTESEVQDANASTHNADATQQSSGTVQGAANSAVQSTNKNTEAVNQLTLVEKENGGSGVPGNNDPNDPLKTPKKAKGAGFAKAMGGIAAGITTALTSDSKQFDLFGTGDTETKSQGLQFGSKIVTGAATGVASAFGGPVAGMLVSTLMDEIINPLLLPWFEKWFDNDSYQIKLLEKASKKAEENLKIISSLQTDAGTLTALSREDVLVGESYVEAEKAFSDIFDNVFQGDESLKLWEQIAENTELGYKSTVEMKRAYMSGSAKERAQIAAALQAALSWQEAREYATTKNDDLYRISQTSRNARTIAKGWNATTFTASGLFSGLTHGGASGNYGLDAAAALTQNTGNGVFHPDPVVNLVLSLIQGIQGNKNRDAINKNSFSNFIQNNDKYKANWSVKTRSTTFDSNKSLGDNIKTFLPLLFGIPALYSTSETYLDMSDQEMRDAMSEYVDQLREQQEAGEDVSKELEQYESQLKMLNKSIAQQKQIYDEVNAKYAVAAVASAKDQNGMFLSTLGNRQLKNLGKDEIIRIIADEIEESGGLMGYDRYQGGTLSKEWTDYIMSALKSDAGLWGIISGNSYTLSELLSSSSDAAKDTEAQAMALRQFAAALGVSVEELKDLEDTFGDLTLGQVIASPEETRASIGELTSLFTSMASSTGLTAENLELIINKFPQLVQYLGDAQSLAGALSHNIGELVKIYGKNISNELMGSEGYFDQFVTNLRKDNEDIYQALLGSDNKTFANATTFKDIIEMMYGDAATYGLSEEQMSKFRAAAKEMFDIYIENTVELERVTTAMQYQSKLYERQIKNLEEQKSALQEINKQREYENRLIEAKIKLEEAQKEKKRVWREGVGWVYESDQKALDEAQKNLDEVKNEKKISELDLQIQQLQAEKDYLDNLPNEKELQNMQEVYEGWAEEVGLYNKSQAEIIAQIAEIYKGIEKINLGEYWENTVKQAEKDQATVEAEAKQRFDAYVAADQHYQTLLNNGTSRSSQEFINAEKERNRTMGEYQKYVTENKGSISSGWYDSNEGSRDALNAETSNYAEKVITVQGKGKFAIEGNPLTPSSQHYKDIQDDAISGKDGEAAWWTTNSDHSQTVGDYIGITGQEFADYYDKSLAKWAQAPEHQNTVIVGSKGADEYAYIKNQEVHKMKKLRRGTLFANGDPTLINEVGTEAIITPAGTITSLPSGSGVIPADITKNVWQLGELAPAILRSLGYPNMTTSVVSGPINNSDSVNIGTISMTVNADNSWNAEKFIEQLKQQASLTKNNKR